MAAKKLNKASQEMVVLMCAQGCSNMEIRKWLHNNLKDNLSYQQLSMYRRRPEVATLRTEIFTEIKHIGTAAAHVRVQQLNEILAHVRNKILGDTVYVEDEDGVERRKKMSPHQTAILVNAYLTTERELSRLVDGSKDEVSALDKQPTELPPLTEGQIANILHDRLAAFVAQRKAAAAAAIEPMTIDVKSE